MKQFFSTIKFYYRTYRRLDIMGKAASLSFFTIIAIFPLVLLLATVSGYFISQQLIQETLTRFIQETLPYQSDLVMQNIFALVQKKEAFGYFGLISLVITSHMLFVQFERTVNNLLHTDNRRHFLVTRMIFLAWLVGLVFILFTPVIIELISTQISTLHINILHYAGFFSKGGFVILGFLVFWFAMLTMPTKRINMRRLFLGSLFFSLTIQVGKLLFKWFTLRTLFRYNLVYGSLSSMVLMTLWILYFYNIFLFFIYWVGRHRDPHYIMGTSLKTSRKKEPLPQP